MIAQAKISHARGTEPESRSVWYQSPHDSTNGRAMRRGSVGAGHRRQRNAQGAQLVGRAGVR